MAGIWTAILLAALCATALAWAAAVLHERGLRPLRRVAAALRRPTWGGVFRAAIAVGFIHHGATKGTNGLDQGAGQLPSVQTEPQGPVLRGGVQDWGGVPQVTNAIAAADCAAGFVLAAVGTGETHAFDPPPDATVCADWAAFGAARDWFRLHAGCWSFPLGTNAVDALTVLSSGSVRPSLPDASTFIAPLSADLSILPAASWHLNPQPSLFWHSLTPSNTLLLTWLDALLGRDPARPVSFQCEIALSGDVTFRYGLSALAEDVVSNVTVGVSSGGMGRTFTCLSRDVTSLRFAHLDPSDATDPDRDGDGIPTADEIFVHGTDPGSVDTDMDGLSDWEELNVTHTDPLNPHSLSPLYPDGVAVAIGGEDPWSCPEGSTNTIWEHVFYTGTTNGAFAYPQSTDTHAVLEVTVSGSGSGTLSVGGTVVPLLAPPPPLRSSPSPAPPTLRVPVPKGVTHPVYLRADGSPTLTVASPDFAFGVMPSLPERRFAGWINFPNVKAPKVCVHHLETRSVSVSLPASAGADVLVCTWEGAGGVEAENRPPRSATLKGRFSPKATAAFPYRLSHPLRLFGRTDYTQEVRFCPRLREEDVDPGEDDGWVDFPEPPGPGPEPELCPEHGVPVEECAHLHEDPPEDYDEASLLPRMAGVLPLRRPTLYADAVPVPVPVPLEGYTPCCPCPEHGAPHASAAYVSPRLSVLTPDGLPFGTVTEPGTALVGGAFPSDAVGDAHLMLSTNGVVSADLRYTVFGTGVSGVGGVDLAMLNAFNPDFGLPVAVGTNAPAENLNLDMNVRLAGGRVRLALANATSRFMVLGRSPSGGWRTLADSAEAPVLDVSAAQWRRMHGKGEGAQFSAPVAVVASSAGTCDLSFRYWLAAGGAFAEDVAVQRITAVDPPLLPDLNRNGMRDADDIGRYIDGNVAYFWKNDDTWKDDDAFSSGSALNVSDGVVNGRNDLVNFLPVAIDLKAFAANWGTDLVRYSIEGDSESLRRAKLSLSDLAWSEMGNSALGEGTDISGVPLHQALVSPLGDGTNLPPAFVSLSQSDSGVVLMEFPSAERYGNLHLNIYSKSDDALLFSSSVRLHVGEVDQMIAWENLRSAAGGSGGVPTRRDTPDWPAAARRPGHVVFVHGYNMHEGEETKLWAQNVFKKLWWSGLDRGFVAVQWRGNEGQVIGTDLTPNYYGNVQNAFATASALKTAMDSYSGPRWLMAHSLGNMLVSAAIQDCEMPYEKYFMLNAAVAMEAFDPVGGITQESHDNMTPEAWAAYPDRLRSTHWWELFPAGDGRRLLTWKGRFAGVTDIVNFYSTQEEVVNNGDGEWHSILKRNYVWYNQETRKGEWAWMLHPDEGGWGFNIHYDTIIHPIPGMPSHEVRIHMSPGDANNLSDSELRQNPFFLDFASSQMHSSSNGAVVATNYLYRAEMLAYAIPAESFAVGANPLPGLVPMMINSPPENLYYNHDMAILFTSGCDDLPENHATDTKKMHRNWQHSTFVQRSYKRVHQLFKVIIQHLKESSDE